MKNLIQNNAIFVVLIIINIFVPSILKSEDTQEHKIIQVEIVKAHRQKIFEPIVIGGYIAVFHDYAIHTTGDGIVEDIYVYPGDFVKKGQLLLTWYPGSKVGYVKQQIGSPITGYLAQSFVKIGSKVRSDQLVMVIYPDDQFYGSLSATYSDIKLLDEGSKITIVLDDDNQEIVLPGSIRSVSYIKSQGNGIYPVQVRVDCLKKLDKKSCNKLLPIGRVIKGIISKNEHMGIQLPESAFHENKTKVILVNEENKAKWVKVEIGQDFGNFIEVKSGVVSGDRVVTNYDIIPPDNSYLKVKVKVKI